jgi:hypothetical protein
MNLNEFGGNCMKGWTFLNSCKLYIALAPHQFINDNAKIMWAFLFMKNGHATQFVDWQMRNYQEIGSISYKMWGDFIKDFMADFCLKNEVQMLRTELETSRFFQGKRTFDEYVDNFKKLNTSREHTLYSNFVRAST